MSRPGDSRQPRTVAAASLGAALTPLNSTMVVVALPAIARDFGIAPATTTLLVVTGYLIATLVCQVPAGSLADRVGHGRMLAWGRAIFAVGALAGALAPTLALVVVGRLLMAAGGAVMVPTSMALLRVAVAPERRSRAFGTLGAVMGTAAAIGPALGGWLAPVLGWRWLFAINIPVIAASWLLQGRTSASAPTDAGASARPARAPFDWAGTVLAGTALVLLTFATRGRGTTALTMAIAGLAALGALVLVERRVPAPVLDLHLFARPVFAAASVVIATQNLAMYSLLTLIPFQFGRSAGASIGVAMAGLTAAMAVTSPLGGRLAERFGARTTVLAGGLLGAFGVIGIARLGGVGTPLTVALWLLPVGTALGLSTGPAQAVGLSAVAADRSGVGAAMLSMARYVGSIAGTVALGLALAGGAAAQQRALWGFAAAFLVSAGMALLLSLTPGRAATAAAPAPAGR